MAEFMLHIIKVNVLSAVIIFIVLAVSKLLDKKYSSRWKYLIWLFVSVFLLIPVKFPSHAGGLNIEVPKQIVRAEVNRSTAVPNTENLQIPADAKENGSEPLKDTGKKADMQDSAGQRNIKVDTIAWIAAIIWGAGICAAAVYKVFVLRAGRRELRRWRIPFTDRERLAEYDKLCKELHMKKAPKLVADSRLSGPLLAGIRNTYLYLPVREYSKEECELIFRHELCHYRSRDLWYKLLMICVTTVYWFNPAVYFMKKEAERDIEFICDEKVMKGRNQEDKLRYNQLILKTAALGRPSYELSTSLNDGLLTFKKRMVNIMKAGKMKRGILPVICFTIVLVTSNIFTGCSLKDSGEKKNDTDTETMTDSGDSKEEEDPSGKEEKDSKETVIKGKSNTAPVAEDKKTDPTAGSEQKESPVETPTPEPVPAKEERTELSGFMNQDSLPAMAQSLGLQKSDSNPDHKEYISDSENKIIGFDISGDSISSWFWLNWPQGDFAPVTTQYMPADGNYRNSNDGEYSTIRITGINDYSFYFSIYRYTEGEGDRQIFMDNIAVFEDADSTTAVFRGQQYTLTFDCSQNGLIVLSGFDDATALGDTFWAF